MENIDKQIVKKEATDIYNEVDNYIDGLTDDEKHVMFQEAFSYALGKCSSHDIEKLREVFKKFKESDDDGKRIIACIFIKEMIYQCASVLISLNKKKCEEEGHKYGEWYECKKTKVEYYDRSKFHSPESALYGTYGKNEIEIVKWRRRCEICGDCQESDIEPCLIEKETKSLIKDTKNR